MATQKEIADRLGVSISLVSRVLSGSAANIGIRQETIDRVLAEAGRQKYAPNAYALALKGRPPKTLAVLVTDFNDPFLAEVLNILQRFSQPNAYTLFVSGVADAGDDPEVARANLQTFRPDGLIWLGGRLPKGSVEPLWDQMECPVVHIGSGPEQPGVRHLMVDDGHAARALIKEAAARGHRKFAWIADNLPAHRDRLQTFIDRARNAGMEIRPEWIIESDSAADEGGESAAGELIRRCGDGVRPTLVFAAGDIVAFGVARRLIRAAWRIPEDVSLVGFDDIPSSRLLIPRLATFAQPVEKMVHTALEWITAPGEKSNEKLVLKVRPGFVIRESLADAPEA